MCCSQGAAIFNKFGVRCMPSAEDGRFDQVSEWVEQTTTNRPVIRAYKPSGLWLWTQWQGTIRSLTIWPILGTMALSCTLCLLQNNEDGKIATELSPLLFWIPVNESLKTLWEHQLTLCTFILTFFTGQAYSHWKTVYMTTRAIQGRLNDVCMLLTVAAEREIPPPTQDTTAFNESFVSMNHLPSQAPRIGPGTTTYSDRAQALLLDCTRLIRLSHTFFWAAAVPTSSIGLTDNAAFCCTSRTATKCKSAIGPLLLSPTGLEALVKTGQLTKNEKQALIDSNLPPSQFVYVLLEWAGSYAINGIRDGTLSTSESMDSSNSHINNNSGFSDNFLRHLTALRGEYFNVGDHTAGRMPLAYVQLVQVLVDSLVFLAPLALYSSGLGYVVIPLTGLLTLFFKGLLELSKSFLDPFGVEGFQDQNIRVDVLVSESNFGARSRWMNAGSSLPIREKLMDERLRQSRGITQQV